MEDTEHNPFCTEVTPEWHPPYRPDYDAWQAARREYLGASDTAAALGRSKWKSPYTLWLEKMGHRQPDPTKEVMHWGNLHEPLIIEEVARLSDTEVLALQVSRTHHHSPYLRCHLDAYVRDGYIEAKQVTAYQEPDWDQDDPPLEYHIQIAHTFACCPDLSFCLLGALFGGNRLRIWKIDRDDELVRQVERGAEEWWEQYVLTGQEPPVTGHDDCRQALQEQHPPKDELPELDLTAHASVLATREQSDELAKQYTEAKKTADNELRRLMGAHTVARINGRKITYRENKNGVRSLRVGRRP